jgi:hypothetical protein
MKEQLLAANLLKKKDFLFIRLLIEAKDKNQAFIKTEVLDR